MLRSGRIIYTNDLPIYTAFDEGVIAYPGALLADVPANLNARLLDGRLDLSPISAFFYGEHADELAILPQICIGARTDVWSVLLLSSEHPSELDGATIAVTRESASGRNLLRILLERRYGVHAQFVVHDDPLSVAAQGLPALLIGDRAIDARQRFDAPRVFDLGTLWHEWTGLDMVFAVWAVRRDVLRRHPELVGAAVDALVRSAQWGAAHIDMVIAAATAAHPRPAGFYEAYYRTLNFDFDDRARAGLTRFFQEAHALGTIPSVPSVVPEELALAR